MKLKFFHKKIFFIILLTGLLFFSVIYFYQPTKTLKTHIITAKIAPITNTLYYTGNIEPFKNIIITSPADAVILQTYFHYGDKIKRGKLLFTLSSQKLLKDYRDNLMQYIKAKSEFLNTQNSLKQTEYLHKKELVSDDELRATQNAFWQARLSLVQAKAALDNISQQLGEQKTAPTELTIKDIDPIINALHANAGALKLEIHAPSDGIILQPYNFDTSSIGGAKKLARGTQVKQDDVLALMGNTDKILVRIEVNEFSINQLKINQSVALTSDALPNMILNGVISSIDHQGTHENNGSPIFSVAVTVSNLNEQQQNVIHIGMRAEVSIKVHQSPAITVPIAAIKQKEFANWVTVRDPKTSKQRDVKIQTGQTTQDLVVVTEGIKAGDQIVVPD